MIAAAEELHAPVMLQTTPSTVGYWTLEMYQTMAASETVRASITACLHLDHGSSFGLVVQAICTGYTSVMIDGAHEGFEENVALNKRVADVARACGILVEGELGRVGGKEDDLIAEKDTNTDPMQAKEFAERTGVSSLAAAIGTAHGFYARIPVLNKLKSLAKKV